LLFKLVHASALCALAAIEVDEGVEVLLRLETLVALGFLFWRCCADLEKLSQTFRT
jgi:hypothetical protein